MTSILGISAFFHDSAACLVVDGEIIAAAQEERFAGIKHEREAGRAGKNFSCKILFGDHHESHAPSAFYPSPLLAEEKIIGLHQGRIEFGPRTLGGRSIVADARSAKMQSVMNLKIKYRESFRPFAPSVLREHVSEWFELNTDSPYMLLVADVIDSRRTELTEEEELRWGIEKLKTIRSQIPAVTPCRLLRSRTLFSID